MNQDVILDGDDLVFGDTRFPANTKTRYHSKVRTDEYYSLKQLWFLMKHKNDRHAIYGKACRENKIDTVTLVDKKDIIQYLTGKADSAQVDAVKVGEAAAREKTEENVVEGADLVAKVQTQGKENEKEQRAASSQSSKKRMKDVTQQTFAILERERCLHDRRKQLSGQKDFTKLIKSTKNIFTNPTIGPPEGRGLKRLLANAANPQSSKKNRNLSAKAIKEEVGGHPIIVVPATLSAMLTLFNATDFLQHAKYVPSKDKKKAGTRKPTKVWVTHKCKNGVELKFRVVDSVRWMKPNDYKRIVCVVAQGQSWQFKGWKIGGKKGKSTNVTPSDVFSKAMGMYVRYDNMIVPEVVKEWKIPVLTISKNRRHFDVSAFNDCWSKIEEFLTKNMTKQLQLWGALYAEEAAGALASSSSSNVTS
eukprot:g1988.t1